MGGDETVLGVLIAVVGGICSVLVARISTPRERPAVDRPPVVDGDDEAGGELKVSPEIWRRFEVLEQKVDHLTAVVETKKVEVTTLERLLRQAMRIVRRANRRLAAVHEPPEEVPRELIPYSID
ncbi:hypothetical protein BV881_12165 [Streptomyces sp. ZL-24]|uniref:hypothetical protein n=1 Tax=Streptomyces sp. ZL-24 TaxID=1933029 RepID=UPI000CD3C70F|nr:hypothetical protein [Streptomyces sp. ZL-24]POG47090.1 hypothetical protein BV881_12165 [Streptomyces sp. ZL-24]